MSRKLRARNLLAALLTALTLSACAVAVRSDRAAIGGGPAQSTAQAQAVLRTTAIALATANSGAFANATPCDCETSR